VCGAGGKHKSGLGLVVGGSFHGAGETNWPEQTERTAASIGRMLRSTGGQPSPERTPQKANSPVHAENMFRDKTIKYNYLYIILILCVLESWPRFVSSS